MCESSKRNKAHGKSTCEVFIILNLLCSHFLMGLPTVERRPMVENGTLVEQLVGGNGVK